MSDVNPAAFETMAVMHHEFFVSYVKAGFTEHRALLLVIAWIQKQESGGADTT
ncbi:hypothetical protein LCGC14_2990020 [marine sediment metagenome]|uniref:Uncharacterized protein n=1 Tax=marine sediment metagenome TaxID=412755 RepID=A0A0F8ZVA4_9ZZZZ